ncbi:LysE family translocator [Sphingosinicella sp. LHD-64]|uniref:LysE family translocator n=1 Tax=Sphingosinicella sp. LHD-64 TaxID=3072139 RepID=UPI00280E2306|nr:LysE family translocator [Sphingosinicella sp. LHD-64]MDQ8755872.1 LysE family translocator [Sphingosinicella sp. LHD-64]
MTTTAAIAYAVALFIAAATPGPAMLAVLSTGVVRGARPALAMGLGVAIGDVVLVGLAILGLAAAAAAFGWLFAFVKYAGAAWLVWLGIRMWRAPVQPLGDAAAREHRLSRQLWLGGAIALGNPKAILFHASLMPLLMDVTRLTLADALVIAAIVFAVNLLIMSAYALLAGRAARWLRTPARIRAVNRAAGGTMVGAGALIATR